MIGLIVSKTQTDLSKLAKLAQRILQNHYTTEKVDKINELCEYFYFLSNLEFLKCFMQPFSPSRSHCLFFFWATFAKLDWPSIKVLISLICHLALPNTRIVGGEDATRVVPWQVAIFGRYVMLNGFWCALYNKNNEKFRLLFEIRHLRHQHFLGSPKAMFFLELTTPLVRLEMIIVV